MNRKIWWRNILLLSFVAVICSSALSIICYADVGEAGAQFLKIGVGARPVGMGECFAGLADDVNAIYWNPGGLSRIEKREATMMYNRWFQDIEYGYVAYAHPVSEEIGVFGGAVSYLVVGDMDRTKVDVDGDMMETNDKFDASDMLITLSYGRKIKMVNAGISLKYIKSKIDDENAAGFAVDLGCLYTTPVPKLDVGLAVQNLGTKIRFISKADPLPLNFRLGASYKMLEKDALTLVMDVNIPVEGNINVHAGGEYWLLNMVALRMGYKTTTVKGLGALSGLSVGCGFNYRGYGIDYAWVPYGDLGNTHRISLTAKF